MTIKGGLRVGEGSPADAVEPHGKRLARRTVLR